MSKNHGPPHGRRRRLQMPGARWLAYAQAVDLVGLTWGGDLRLTNQWIIVAETSQFCWATHPWCPHFMDWNEHFLDWHSNFLGGSKVDFYPISSWWIFPIGWFPSWVSSRLAARWISLDLNADHYPTATGLKNGACWWLMVGGCWTLWQLLIWVWVNTYRYIFSGMNIHLPAILGLAGYKLSHDNHKPC